MWARVAMQRPNNVHCIPEALSFYRRRPGQLSANWRSMQLGRQQLISKMECLAPRAFLLARDEIECKTCLHCAFLAHEQGDYFDAIRLLWDGFQRRPRDVCRRTDLWLLAAASLAGILLPPRIHRWLTRSGAHLHRRVHSRLAAGSKPN